MPLIFKLALGIAWLGLAHGLASSSVGRRIFAYAAAIVVCMHVGATVGVLLQNIFWPPSGSFSLRGYLIGVALGILLGVGVARYAVRLDPVYWVVQVLAVAFVLLFPMIWW
jgi:hypothetical protein